MSNEKTKYTPTKRATKAASTTATYLRKLDATGNWVLMIAKGIATAMKGDALEGAELEQYVNDTDVEMEWSTTDARAKSNKSQRSNIRRIGEVYARFEACYGAYCKRLGVTDVSRILANKLVTAMKKEPNNKRAVALMFLETAPRDKATGLKLADELITKFESGMTKVSSKAARFAQLQADLAAAFEAYRG